MGTIRDRLADRRDSVMMTGDALDRRVVDLADRGHRRNGDRTVMHPRRLPRTIDRSPAAPTDSRDQPATAAAASGNSGTR